MECTVTVTLGDNDPFADDPSYPFDIVTKVIPNVPESSCEAVAVCVARLNGIELNEIHVLRPDGSYRMGWFHHKEREWHWYSERFIKNPK